MKLAIALALLGLVGTVHAESLVVDPSGDLAASIAGTGLPVSPAWNGLDLTGLDVLETPDSLIFSVQVAALPSPTEPGIATGGYIRIHIDLNGTPYSVLIVQAVDSAIFNCEVHEGDDAVNALYTTSGHVDTEINGIQCEIPKHELARSGLPEGTILTGLSASSESFLTEVAQQGQAPASRLVRITDQAPNSGAGPDIKIQFGLRPSSKLQLTADPQFRSSNGEAGAILFKVNAENLLPAKQTVRLDASDLPSAWNVSFPVPAFALHGGGQTEFPVVATIPFGHEHGGSSTFLVNAYNADSNELIGTIRLGLVYLAIPQPAGHHNELYVHARPLHPTLQAANAFTGQPDFELYLQTTEPETGSPMRPRTQVIGVDRNDYTWVARLEPLLSTGLLLRPGQDAELSVAFQGTIPGGANLEAAVLVLAPTSDSWTAIPPYGERNVTLLFQGSSAIQLTQTGWSGKVALNHTDVTKVDYLPGQDLVLELRLTPAIPGIARLAPTLNPGTWIDLPLLEYTDPMADAFGANGLKALQAGTVLVNPGKATVLEFDAPGSVLRSTVEVLGTNRDWVHDVRVEGHHISIQVNAPTSASTGDRADLVISTQTAAGSVTLLTRSIVEVDSVSPHESRELPALGNQESPSVAWLGALLSLTAAAAIVGRKR